MTLQEIAEREEALRRYCAWIDQQCRELDGNPDRVITGLPWTTRQSSEHAQRPEMRNDW